MVSNWLTERGMEHIVTQIEWQEGEKHDSETARNRRYLLFKNLCSSLNLNTIVTGHHANDQVSTFPFWFHLNQIETLILRIAHSSGTFGLSCIPSHRSLSESLHIIRPLLSVTKGTRPCIYVEVYSSRMFDTLLEATKH